MLPFVDELVLDVSKCARYGSMMFNTILLSHLERSKGSLPDSLDISNDKVLNNLIRHCFVNDLGDPHVNEVFERHRDVFADMVPQRLKGDGNAITYSSNQYITNFKNHVNVNIEDRVKELIKSFLKYHDMRLAKGERWLAEKRVRGESKDPFHQSTPGEFVKFVDHWSTEFALAKNLKTLLEFTYKALQAIKEHGGR